MAIGTLTFFVRNRKGSETIINQHIAFRLADIALVLLYQLEIKQKELKAAKERNRAINTRVHNQTIVNHDWLKKNPPRFIADDICFGYDHLYGIRICQLVVSTKT